MHSLYAEFIKENGSAEQLKRKVDEITVPVEVSTERDTAENRIPMLFQNGRILTQHGLSIVEGVDNTAFENEAKSVGGDLVLGFESKHGLRHMEDFKVGKLCCERFVAAARCKLWWMTPEWGRSARDLVPETQFLLMELCEGGPYAVLLPLIDSGIFRATLRPPPRISPPGSEEMVLRVESGDETVTGQRWDCALYASSGWNPYELLDHAVVEAAKLSGGAKARTDKILPDSLDVFGWCTWDAFYSTVSAKGIVNGLDTLAKGGFSPKLLIIDDGWQTTGVDNTFRDARPSAPNMTTWQDTGSVRLPQDKPSGSAPSSQADDEDEYVENKDEAKAASTIQRFGDWCVGMMTSFFILAYDWFVDQADPESAAVRMFSYLANGPLRERMLGFYAKAGDFSHRLTSVRANGKFSSPTASQDKKNKKTGNLAEVIQYLKSEKGVDYVYFWHGLSAYWGGVSQEAPEMAKYNPRVLRTKPTASSLEVEPSMAWNPAVVAGLGVVDNPEQLYLDMHSYLQSSGATGVKVDAQAGVGLVGSMLGGGPAFAYKWHKALEESVQRHFPGNHAINCMCHSTENLYRMLNTAVARASDDFYPRDKSSVTPHIASCAYNSLFMSPLVQTDWDMFQTRHEAADLHAAARSVSGGAIYISDKPGQHNFDVLRRLVLPDGSILRPLLPARPTRDCLFRNVLKDGETLLKVWTRNHVSGVVGVFNLQGSSWDRRLRRFKIHNTKPPTLRTRVTPNDVEVLSIVARRNEFFDGQYAAYSMRRKKLVIGGQNMCVGLDLSELESEIVSFSPVLKVANVEIAPIGFPHLLNGSGAVQSCSGRRVKISQLEYELGRFDGNDIEDLSESLCWLKRTSTDTCTLVDIRVKGCDEFLIYASAKPIHIWIDFVSSEFEYIEEKKELRITIGEGLGLRHNIQVFFR